MQLYILNTVGLLGVKILFSVIIGVNAHEN